MRDLGERSDVAAARLRPACWTARHWWRRSRCCRSAGEILHGRLADEALGRLSVAPARGDVHGAARLVRHCRDECCQVAARDVVAETVARRDATATLSLESDEGCHGDTVLSCGCAAESWRSRSAHRGPQQAMPRERGKGCTSVALAVEAAATSRSCRYEQGDGERQREKRRGRRTFAIGRCAGQGVSVSVRLHITRRDGAGWVLVGGTCCEHAGRMIVWNDRLRNTGWAGIGKPRERESRCSAVGMAMCRYSQRALSPAAGDARTVNARSPALCSRQLPTATRTGCHRTNAGEHGIAGSHLSF